VVEEGLTGGLSAADRERFEEELADASPEVQDEVASIYDAATLDGFQGAIIVGGIVALFGALVAIRLPKQKLEAKGEGIEEIVRETVRNPTIAKMHFEMDDLSASADPKP
jgi:hypothetical protein